jgi:hypothetical protein
MVLELLNWIESRRRQDAANKEGSAAGWKRKLAGSRSLKRYVSIPALSISSA